MKLGIGIALLFSASIAIAAEYPTITGKDGKVYHTGLIHRPDALKGFGETHFRFADCDNLPESFDLRDHGVVPPVKDQGSCGSCWSFSKTASLESALMASGAAGVDLSEQEMVSCDKGQWGCNGGLLKGFKYQIDHGQGLEEDFPYAARDLSCKKIDTKAKGVSFAYVGASNRRATEEELKCALFKTKTIPWVVVSATSAWGNPPSSDKVVYNNCSRQRSNHAVGIVGWFKAENGKTAFIMRNSWGPNWGDKGYMSMPLGCDNLGEELAYIMVDTMPCKPPVVKLPAMVHVEKGTEVMLGVKEVPGTTYTWLVDGKEVAKGGMIYVTPEAETVYKLVAKNPCGVAESQVKIVVN